jgi:type IV secretion system protein VirD4
MVKVALRFSAALGSVLVSTFPPRGCPHGGPETLLDASWSDPLDLPESWTWKQGRFLLGQDDTGRRMYGVADNRHIVTIAGSRAGKTRYVIVPNLRSYPGPVLVIDPKGELARDTAADREKFGPVHVLDPFGVTGRPRSRHNPFDELRASPPGNVSADAALLADALIVDSGGDSHWTDSARNLVKGLILHLLATEAAPTLARLLQELSMPAPVLGRTFFAMGDNPAFGGALANIGAAFLSMMEVDKDGTAIGTTRELASILSTARQQTSILADLNDTTAASDFRLAEIGAKNLTVYLVLPGMRLGTHFRWLRLVLMQAMAAMEMNPILRDKLPAWFVLEEFPALGYMRSIESAAGYMAGFGVRLWAVLQDLSQLKTHYKNSWETFLGNAGVIQAFGNVDATTTKYLSELLGQTMVQERKSVHTTADQRAHGHSGTQRDLRTAPLLAPNEIAMHFGRDTGRHLILIPGEGPTYLRRLGWDKEQAK